MSIVKVGLGGFVGKLFQSLLFLINFYIKSGRALLRGFKVDEGLKSPNVFTTLTNNDPEVSAISLNFEGGVVLSYLHLFGVRDYLSKNVF